MDYSNIGAMLSQLKGQSSYTGKSQSLSSVTEKQAVELLLKGMEPGQIFSGEITDIRGSYITITLQNMQSVQARLAENFEFLIGQKAMFQVKENQDNQLLIRPLAMNSAQNGELMVAERALQAAGIQMTEKTLELVRNLMTSNQPIDKQSILSYVRQLAKFPQAEISDLISLHKYQIPVNDENVQQLSNYKQFEHSLLKDIAAASQGMPELVEKLAEESPQKAQEFLKGFTDVLLPKNGQQEQAAVSQQAAVPEQQSAASGEHAAVMTAGNESEKSVSLQELPEQKSAPKAEGSPLEKLANTVKESSFFEKKEWKQEIRGLLKDAMEEAFLLKPEEIADKEKVKSYYKGIQEKSEGLKELFQSVGKEAEKLEKPMQNMNENVRFMQSLNEAFTYIQLPLKMSNEQAHGDLYVYTKKKSARGAEEGVSALLHLDMEHLGAVDVLVRLNKERVVTNFTLETEELLDFIEQHMELLAQRLKKKGYSCQTQVTVKDSGAQQESFEQLLTGETEAYSDIKRFSFDVRA